MQIEVQTRELCKRKMPIQHVIRFSIWLTLFNNHVCSLKAHFSLPGENKRTWKL